MSIAREYDVRVESSGGIWRIPHLNVELRSRACDMVTDFNLRVI